MVWQAGANRCVAQRPDVREVGTRRGVHVRIVTHGAETCVATAQVSSDDAITMARRLAVEEGVMVGSHCSIVLNADTCAAAA